MFVMAVMEIVAAVVLADVSGIFFIFFCQIPEPYQISHGVGLLWN